MKCAKVEDVVLFVNRQQDDDTDAELRAHLHECERCHRLLTEINSITARLAAVPDEFDDDALVGDVMTLVRLGQAKKEKLSRVEEASIIFRWAAPAVAAAVICALSVFFWPYVSDQHKKSQSLSSDADQTLGFRARGGNLENFEPRASFKIFKAIDSGYSSVKERITPQESLAFTYDNRDVAQYRYLMIVGADQNGRVYWYYPPHVDKGENPKSIQIHQTGKSVQLPDEIKHNLSLGKLRIWALFSKTPLDVNGIEKTIESDFKQQGRIELLKPIGGDNVAEQSYLLEVAER